jgi:hypothetical protein
VAGRIRSIQESNGLIGNRTRYLLACSIVTQPTTLPHALLLRAISGNKISEYSSDEDSSEVDDYIQLDLPGIHKISDSDNEDYTVTQEENGNSVNSFLDRMLDHVVVHRKHSVYVRITVQCWWHKHCYSISNCFFILLKQHIEQKLTKTN